MNGNKQWMAIAHPVTTTSQCLFTFPSAAVIRHHHLIAGTTTLSLERHAFDKHHKFDAINGSLRVCQQHLLPLSSDSRKEMQIAWIVCLRDSYIHPRLLLITYLRCVVIVFFFFFGWCSSWARKEPNRQTDRHLNMYTYYWFISIYFQDLIISRI